jgi:hypothetical protein
MSNKGDKQDKITRGGPHGSAVFRGTPFEFNFNNIKFVPSFGKRYEWKDVNLEKGTKRSRALRRAGPS